MPELNLNQYSVGSPCRTICTVCGSPPCPDLNLIHYIYRYLHLTLRRENRLAQQRFVVGRRHLRGLGLLRCLFRSRAGKRAIQPLWALCYPNLGLVCRGFFQHRRTGLCRGNCLVAGDGRAVHPAFDSDRRADVYAILRNRLVCDGDAETSSKEFELLIFSGSLP